MQRPEQALHIQVAQFLRLALPAEVIWFHPPNGGLRTKREAALMKAMGVRAGVPDLVFVLPGRLGALAAFIELKAAKGRASPDQRLFADAAKGLGAAYALCRSIDEVADALRSWGVNLKVRLA